MTCPKSRVLNEPGGPSIAELGDALGVKGLSLKGQWAVWVGAEAHLCLGSLGLLGAVREVSGGVRRGDQAVCCVCLPTPPTPASDPLYLPHMVSGLL